MNNKENASLVLNLEQSIKKHLKNDIYKITLLDSVDSTNSYLKTAALKGEEEFSAVIALSQTAGRGRLGRSFYSPSDTGIYLSLLVRPELSAQNALVLTTFTAVAVSKAIENVTKKDTQIKWVNDIFLNGKKVAGILCESSVDIKTSKLDFAVIGIGINVYPPKEDFPLELRDVATSLESGVLKNDIRGEIIAGVLDTFYNGYQNISDSSVLEEYKKRSYLDGKTVTYIKNGTEKEGKVIGVDNDIGLVVEDKNGKRTTLNSGEVSVKIKESRK